MSCLVQKITSLKPPPWWPPIDWSVNTQSNPMVLLLGTRMLACCSALSCLGPHLHQPEFWRCAQTYNLFLAFLWVDLATSKKCKMTEWVRTGLVESENDLFTLDCYQITWIGFHHNQLPLLWQNSPYRMLVILFQQNHMAYLKRKDCL